MPDAQLHVDPPVAASLTVQSGTKASVAAAYGLKGAKGDPGYTPVRGIDYWTENDQNQIINTVSAAVSQDADRAETAAGYANSYAETAQAAAITATEKAESVTGLRVRANSLSPGSAATAEYQNGLLTLGIPRGEQGQTGPTGATGERGQRGPSGPQGVQGETGATPDFSIGDVQTLATGSPATASITGTTEHPVLNLGLPRGLQGEAGPAGQDGHDGQDGAAGRDGVTPDFSIGTVSTLTPGSSATAEITGTAAAPVLNLGIPAGQDGTIGYTPDISIGEVTTVEPGGSATATITGTPEEPVLNLGIPAGANGQNGTTPVKGTDYWTTADKGEIINAAVAATLAAYPAAESELF